MVIYRKNKGGATLVELAIVIMIVSIIGATIGGSVIFFVQMFFFSPRQLNTQNIARELEWAMLEGDENARGIRYTSEVLDASSVQFSYTYGYLDTNKLSVRFRYDDAGDLIYQSTSTDSGASWSPEQVVPYHIQSDTIVEGKDSPLQVFSYKKSSDAPWVSGVDSLTDIRRVVISLRVKTQSGNFQDFQGSSEITSSVEVKSF